MSYSFESRVRFSEIGEDGCLTLPGVRIIFRIAVPLNPSRQESAWKY